MSAEVLSAPALAAVGVRVVLGGRAVLEGVELALRPGEVTALVGPNGAGKSTLLACLAGLRTPDAGHVRLDEGRLDRLAPRARARRIGFLPQTPEVAWRLDVETLVALGRTPHAPPFGPDVHARAVTERVLQATGLQALRRRDVLSLSGGERARALIARALTGEPAWLLADEPLTGLDLAHQLDIAELFRRFAAAGGGVVLSVHDLGFAARIARRVVVLAAGRVLADAPPRAALAPEVLAAAYGVDADWLAGRGGAVLDVAGRASTTRPSG